MAQFKQQLAFSDKFSIGDGGVISLNGLVQALFLCCHMRSCDVVCTKLPRLPRHTIPYSNFAWVPAVNTKPRIGIRGDTYRG
jgi:hypothetical protein